MMTIATRLAICLRAQIIIKNFTAVHNRTICLSVVLLCIKKILAFLIASIAAVRSYCDLSSFPCPSIYSNVMLMFSSLIPCTFSCPSLFIHNMVLTFVNHHFVSVSFNRNLSHSVRIFVCVIIRLTFNVSPILIGSLPFRLLSHIRFISARLLPEYFNRSPFQIILWPQLHLNIQSVPRSKHSVSVIQTSQLMLYREIMAVCSQIHTKHINTLCVQNVELLNAKLAVYKGPVRTAQ